MYGNTYGDHLAWCKLEDTARHHFKFNRLAGLLGIHRAEARGLFLGLCSWALTNAPDGLLIGLTHRDIDEASDWQGRKGRLAEAYIECGLIDVNEDKTMEIHGFFERAESHKAAQKKRLSRDRLKTVSRLSQDGLDERRGEERTETPDTPQIRAIDSRKGKPMTPFVLAEFRRAAVEHNRPLPENHTTPDEWAAADVYVKYPTGWKAIIERYMQDDFYERYGWSLQNLAKNIDMIANRQQPKELTSDDIPF